jgi:hypothetical protein
MARAVEPTFAAIRGATKTKRTLANAGFNVGFKCVFKAVLSVAADGNASVLRVGGYKVLDMGC